MELPVNSLVQLEIGFRLDINQLTFPCMIKRTVSETLAEDSTAVLSRVAIILLLSKGFFFELLKGVVKDKKVGSQRQ